MNYIHGKEQALEILQHSSLPLIVLGHGRVAYCLKRFLKNKKISITGYLSDYENNPDGGCF